MRCFCAATHLNTLFFRHAVFRALSKACTCKGEELKHIVTTGRTHLMDAMPVTMQQVLGGWASQLDKGAQRVLSALGRTRLLAIGGTAVGTVGFLRSLEERKSTNTI